MRKLTLGFFGLLAIVALSCGNDNQEIDITNLEGKWSLVRAERNGKPTETLDNAFFNISSENFSHNLNGDSIAVKYSVENNKLMLLDDALLKEMKLLKLTEDTLTAATAIGKFNFKFLMSKDVSK